MKYCPETVLVQSAFVLAEKKLEIQPASKDDAMTVVESSDIIANAIRDVCDGLNYDSNNRILHPPELDTLLYKIHAWIYWTWRRDLGIPGGTYFIEFPPLPTLGTQLYLEVVKKMEWEELLIEFLLFSNITDLRTSLLQLVPSITQHPDNKDLHLLVVLFDTFVKKTFLSSNEEEMTEADSAPEIILTELSAVCSKITNTDSQFVIVKRIIEFVYYSINGGKAFDNNILKLELLNSGDKTHTNPVPIIGAKTFNRHRYLERISSATRLEIHNVVELRKLCIDLMNDCCDDQLTEEINDHKSSMDNMDGNIRTEKSLSTDQTQTDNSMPLKIINGFIEMLHCLLTQHWSNTFNWSNHFHGDKCCSQMDSSVWHPLHRWIVGLLTVLDKLLILQEEGPVSDKVRSLHQGIVGYIEKYATLADEQLMSSLTTHEGETDDVIPDEELVLPEGFQSSLHCRFLSPNDQFQDALWRVHHRLDGYEGSMDWLLTAEEFYCEPDWLECIKNNAVSRVCSKQQSLMIIDIICVQWQMINDDPTAINQSIYLELREVLKQLFTALPDEDKNDLIKYSFSMSMSVTKDATQGSIFFHPSNVDRDRSRMVQDMRVAFNRLVDKGDGDASQRSSFNGIAELFLISPAVTLSSALQTAVQYGRTHTICKILQSLPAVCQLILSDTDHPLLCSMLAVQARNVSSQQDENNLFELVGILLQPNEAEGSKHTKSPLLAVIDLVKCCILPYLYHHSNQDGIPLFIALKLLRSCLMAISPSQSEDRTFVMKYLIPIILCLCKLLYGCKVCWEGLVPVPSPAEVAKLRGLVLAVLGVAVQVVIKFYEDGMMGLATPVKWLHNKVQILDWTLPLLLRPLLTHILAQPVPLGIPACLFNICDLPSDSWTPSVLPGHDPMSTLFEGVGVSDIVAHVFNKALLIERLLATGCDVMQSIVENMIKVMSYQTEAETQRVVNLCLMLILQEPGHDSRLISMSRLLGDVMTKLVSPCCSSWATPRVLSHVIRNYVTVLKQLCAETGKERPSDVIATLTCHVCHVMSLLPDDVTHPLFVLTLHLVSMATISDDLRLSVAKLPQQVHREALLQKLSNP